MLVFSFRTPFLFKLSIKKRKQSARVYARALSAKHECGTQLSKLFTNQHFQVEKWLRFESGGSKVSYVLLQLEWLQVQKWRSR